MTVFIDRNNQLRIKGSNKPINQYTFNQLKKMFPTVKGKTKLQFLHNLEIDAFKNLKKKKIKTLIYAIVGIIVISVTAALIVGYVLS